MTDLVVPNGNEDAVQPPQTLPPPNYAITEGGMVITITVAPGTAIQHAIPAQLMHEIVKKWREVERANASTAALVADVMRSKR